MDSQHLINIIVRLKADAKNVAQEMAGISKQQRRLNDDLERGATSAGQYNKETEKMRRSNRELSDSLDTIRHDLRRAGRSFQDWAKNDKNIKQLQRSMVAINKTSSQYARTMKSTSRDVDTHTRKVGRLSSGFFRLRKSIDDNNRGLARLRHWLDRNAGGAHELERRMALLGRSIAGFVVAGVLIFTQAFATALVGLAGQAVAVGSSLGYAAGVLVGSFIPAIAQAIPMIGILIGAMQRLSLIQEAITQQDALRETAADRDAAAKERQKDAADAVKDAELALMDAKRNVSQAEGDVKSAQDDLTESRKEAKEEIEGLRLAEEAAALSFKRSILDQKEARKDLQQAIREGEVSAIPGLQLGIQEAALARRQAAKDARESRNESKIATREGVEGSDQVVAAKERVRDATRSVADAQRNLAQAHRNARVAAEDQTSTEARLDFAIKQLTESEKKLMQTFIRFRDRLEKEFTPITDILIRSFTRGLNRFEDLLFDNRIMRGIERLTRGMADGLDQLTKAATDERSKKFWEFTLKEGRRNLKPLTDIAESLLRIFQKFARAAAPAFRKILFLISKELDSLSKADLRDLREFFLEGVKHLRAWWNLLKAVINLFAALAGAGGAKSGLKTVREFTDTINEAAEEVRKNSEEISKFFEDSGDVLSTLGKIIIAMGDELIKVFDPEAMEAFAGVITKVIIPAIGIHIRVLGLVAKALNDILRIPFVAEFASFAIALGIVTQTLRLMQVFLKALVLKPLQTVVNKLPGFQKGLEALKLRLGFFIGRAGGLAAFSRALGVVGVAIFVVVGAIKAIEDNFLGAKDAIESLEDTFKDIKDELEELGQAFSDLFKEISGGDPQALKKFGKIVLDVLGIIEKFVGAAAVHLFVAAFKAMMLPIRTIINFLQAFTRILRGFREFFAGFVDVIGALIRGDWGDAWDGLKRMARGALDVVLGALQSMASPFEAAITSMADILDDILGGAFRALRNTAIDAIDGILGGLSSLLRGFADVAEEAPSIPGFDPGQGAADQANEVADNVDNLRESLRREKDEQEEATKADKQAIRTRDRALAGLSDLSKGHKDLKKDTDKSSDSTRRHGKEASGLTKELKDELRGAGLTRKEIRQLGRTHIGAAKTSQKLGGTIAEITNKVLKQFSAKELKFGISKEGQGIRTPTELGQSTAFQKGGFIGARGMRGADTQLIRAGLGEAVITGHDEPYVETAMRFANRYGRVPYASLDDMFKGQRKPHQTAPYYQAPPMEYGRRIGYQKGGRIPKGGFPDADGALPGLDALAWVLNKKFGLRVVDGLRPGGVTTTGNRSDHAWGGAIDVSNGVTTPQMDAAYRWMRKVIGGGVAAGESISGGIIKQMLYRTMIGGNHFDHIHVALLESAARSAQKVMAAIGGKLGAFGGPAAIPKLQIKGPKGALKKQLQLQSDEMRKEANKYLAKKTGGVLGAKKYHPGEYSGVLTPKQFISIALQALKITDKFPATQGNAQKLLSLARSESGLKVDAINDWDSNAQAGIPSQGLMQVIPPTFRTYHQKGTNGILDPLANIAASINYQAAEYGRLLSDGPYRKGGRIGYAGEFGTGGTIPGVPGTPKIAVVHSGETIIPRMNEGGRIPEYSKRGNTLDDEVIDIFKDISKSLKDFIKGKGKLKGVEKLIEKLLGEGELFDQLTEALEQLVTDLSSKILKATFNIVKIGKDKSVVKVLSDYEVAVQELTSLEIVGDFLQDQQKDLNKLLRRLKKLLKKAKSKEKEKIKTAINNVEQRLEELGAQIGENLQERWEAQLAVIEARIAEFEFQINLNDIQIAIIEGFEELTGKLFTGATIKQIQENLSHLGFEKAFLEAAIAKAVARGDKELENELRTQLGEVSSAILDAHVAIMNEYREAAQKAIENVERIVNVRQAQQAIIEGLQTLNDQILGPSIRKYMRQQLDALTLEAAAIQQQIQKAYVRGDTEFARELEETLFDVQGQIIQTQIEIMQSYRDEFSKTLEQFDFRIGLRNARIAIFESLGELNDTLFTEGITKQLRQNLSELQLEVASIQQQIKKAQARGDTEFVRELQETLLDVQNQVIEAQITIFQAYRDAARESIQKFADRINIIEARERIFELQTELIGALFPLDETIDFIRQRIKELENQRLEIQRQLDAAIARGDKELREELEQGLLDNQAELLQAHISIMEAFRTATNEAIGEFQDRIGIIDLRKRILDLQGEISGTINQAGLIALAEQTGAELRGQRGEIERGLAGAKQRADVKLIEELERALLENEIALLENTKELKELNGQLGDPQSFTSTAWELFRVAVFNGMGGLMPQFQQFVPSMQSGGIIHKEGIYHLHRGERVTPEGGGDQTNVFNFNETMEIADPTVLANRIAFELKTKRATI